MASQLIYLAYVLLVYLLMALPIILVSYLAAKRLPVERKVLSGFLTYGLLSGIVSSYWRTKSDMPWLANLPGELLGHWLHSPYFWFLDLPQVFVPASLMFWGAVGMLLQTLYLSRRSANQSV